MRNQWGNFLTDLVISGICPMLAYGYLKDHLGWSELHALTAVIVFPLLGAGYNLRQARTVDIVSALAILGIGISLVAALMGGSPKLLLIRESLLTIVLGLASFASLLTPYPLLYFFARATVRRGDPVQAAEFERKYREIPRLRRAFQVVTVGWGFCFTLEFVLKVILVYSLTVKEVLVVGPIVSNSVTLAAFGLTFAYFRRLRPPGAEPVPVEPVESAE